jgi:DNA-binding MarR family transcriptional regulator
MSGALTKPESPRASDGNLGYLFRLAHQRFRALFDDELAELGLTAQEYGVLSVFETRTELSTSELARISQVTRQTMHTAVLALETAGLLERKVRNRRVVLIRPTRQGRLLLGRSTERVRAVESSALVGLSRDEQRTVRAWLATVAAMPADPRHVAGRRKAAHAQVGRRS